MHLTGAVREQQPGSARWMLGICFLRILDYVLYYIILYVILFPKQRSYGVLDLSKERDSVTHCLGSVVPLVTFVSLGAGCCERGKICLPSYCLPSCLVVWCTGRAAGCCDALLGTGRICLPSQRAIVSPMSRFLVSETGCRMLGLWGGIVKSLAWSIRWLFFSI